MPNERNEASISRLMARLVQGKSSRREFMEGATALGLTIAAATSLISEARAAVPKKGGLLRAGLDGGATTDTLDPAVWADTFIIAFNFGCLRNCLTEVDNQGKLVGELAEHRESVKGERMEAVGDGRTATDRGKGRAVDGSVRRTGSAVGGGPSGAGDAVGCGCCGGGEWGVTVWNIPITAPTSRQG